MKRLCLAAQTAVCLALPSGTQASAPTHRHESQYARLYRRVAAKLGHRAPGRNILRWGMASGRAASDGDIGRSIGVLHRLLAPPPAPSRLYVPESAPATVTPTAAPAPTGAPGVPACASESGTNYSTGPANTNPSSGATGRYQILPSTAAGYGCDLSTPAGQDACAQVIYANQGAGAWVGCGG